MIRLRSRARLTSAVVEFSILTLGTSNLVREYPRDFKLKQFVARCLLMMSGKVAAILMHITRLLGTAFIQLCANEMRKQLQRTNLPK
jgi:hypothetical protein